MSGDNLHRHQPLIFYSSTFTESKRILIKLKKTPSREGELKRTFNFAKVDEGVNII